MTTRNGVLEHVSEVLLNKRDSLSSEHRSRFGLELAASIVRGMKGYTPSQPSLDDAADPNACVVNQGAHTWVRGRLLSTTVVDGHHIAVVATVHGKLVDAHFSNVYMGRCTHCATGLIPVEGTGGALYHGRDYCPDRNPA